MLWRFSFASTSTLDSLLVREMPPSIEEVMDDTDVLQECKAQNNKLVHFLGREESIKSLLHWVVSGLDELEDQSRQADRACLAKGRQDPNRYPPLKPDTQSDRVQTEEKVPDVPLEPAKIAEAALEKEDEADLSAGNMGMLRSAAPAGTEDDEARRARYPSVAAEILTSEVWVIPETILANKEALLRPFWDAVIPPISDGMNDGSGISREALYEGSELYRARVEYGTDEDDERDRKREMIKGLWVKVNGNLLAKRTHEMIRFIQAIPNIVPRLIAQIHSPAIQDIIIRLISSEEAGVAGVIQWLAQEKLVSRLTSLLSPFQAPHVHVLVTELLKNIVTLCAPPPFNPLGGNMQEQQSAQGATSGTRDNRMVRELVSEESIRRMVGFMLDPLELSDIAWKGLNGDGTPHPADAFIVHPLPSIASAASSLSSISAILVELIRRNNSDFAEPHLFHTLRNRLINMRMEQGAPLGQMEGGDREDQDRERMEEAVKGMVEAMGIVHLKSLMDVFCERFERLYQLLLEPRSQKLAASPLLAKPLTLERFRIVELYAELLHSSNMSILNRPPGTGPEYTYDGILSGGLAGLEALGEAIDEDRESPGDAAPEGQVTQARELPVSSNASTAASLSGEEMGSDSEDEKMLEDIEEEATPSGSPSGSGFVSRLGDKQATETMATVAHGDSDFEGSEAESTSLEVKSSDADVAFTTTAGSIVVENVGQMPSPSPPSRRRREASPATLSALAPGERLKRLYLDHRVFSTLIDMFFDYSSNDFLHHVVYDMLQQILNGKLSPGLNRDLLEEMICQAKLVERVLEAQRHNDRVSAGGKHPRLPYMGHIILISEELVKFLVRCPQDLLDTVLPFIPQPDWDNFVAGQLSETRARDAQPLAGGKPMLSGTMAGEGASSKSEDESSGSDSDDEEASAQLGGFGTFGEPLQRTKAAEGWVRRGSGNGGEADNDDTGSEEESTDRYWRNTAGLRRHVDSSDEDEDDADWLRPSDDFGGFSSAQRSGPSDEFDDDEAWGTFSSGGGTSTTNDDPFGDDNFAPLNESFSPSVQPRASGSSAAPVSLERGAPLTPHDWFDREFSSAWGEGDEDESVPAIIVPDADESEAGPEAGEADLAVPRTPGSTWSFSGDENEGEDLPSAISPVIDQQHDEDDGSKSDGGAQDLSHGVAGLGISEVSAPMSISRSPPATSNSTHEGLPSESALSSSPSNASPVPSRSPHTAPLAIPSSPQTQSQKSRRPPPPPSPRKRRTSSQSSDSKYDTVAPALGISPSQASGPSSLVSAASHEQPLGPGVSEDVGVTNDGMLVREIDGREITVPKDEIAMGVAEAVADTHTPPAPAIFKGEASSASSA